MLNEKAFLLEECENIKQLLNDTLRYEYGGDGRHFYLECLKRLNSLNEAINEGNSLDQSEISSFQTALSNLSLLISLIERGHYGEFSWAFADSIKDLAKKICQDPFLDDPLFFMSSEGGLASYAMFPEQGEIDLVERQIFNIVFPRTLKNHVLLHPILGHEVGHAAWCVVGVNEWIELNVINQIIANSPLATVEEFKGLLKKLGEKPDSYTDDTLDGIRNSWAQELYCDLFGLLLIGPAFVPAQHSLLQVMEPSGQVPGYEHPANITRFLQVSRALELLGWKEPDLKLRSELQESSRFAISSPIPLDSPDSTIDYIDQGSLKTALNNLKQKLDEVGILYPGASHDEITPLVDNILASRPPINFYVNDSMELITNAPDFRQILWAGWLASCVDGTDKVKPTFYQINRLCNQAILQCTAVRLWKNYHERT